MNKAKAKFLVVRRHWAQVGEERERDRIIKLLEPQVTLHREQGLEASAEYLTHLIALIQGEN